MWNQCVSHGRWACLINQPLQCLIKTVAPCKHGWMRQRCYNVPLCRSSHPQSFNHPVPVAVFPHRCCHLVIPHVSSAVNLIWLLQHYNNRWRRTLNLRDCRLPTGAFLHCCEQKRRGTPLPTSPSCYICHTLGVKLRSFRGETKFCLSV